MRIKTNTAENCAPRIVPSAPWRLQKVKPLINYCLAVEFLDGTKGIVDMKELIHSLSAGVFSSLKKVENFNKVFLDCGVVTWSEGIDIAPDTMYEAIKKDGRCILR